MQRDTAPAFEEGGGRGPMRANLQPPNQESDMNPKKATLAFAVLLLGAAAGSAQARYLCDAPPTPLDARACEAARQGPAELRQFVQRMQSIQNLLFSDYVNQATELAWAAKKQRRPIQTAGTLAAREVTSEPR
jgi:hypothetical protein